MTAEELLNWLRDEGVLIETVSGKLRCDAPKGVLTPEIRALLARHKQQLIDLLQLTPAPQSPSQERLWFLQGLNADSPAYNEVVALSFSGPLRVACLEQALNDVVRRHEILRTSFPASATGEPLQVVEAYRGGPISVVDLMGLEFDAAWLLHLEICATEARRPFVLNAGPPFRIVLFRFAADRHVLWLLMHHIITDGWSMRILWREFASSYRLFWHGRAHSLVRASRQYSDFARWQRQILRGEAVERHLGYWRKRLSGAPLVLELPRDYARPQVQSFDGASYDFDVSRALTDDLHKFSRRTGASVFLCLLAVFEVLVYRYTAQEDFVFGVPVSGRERPEFEDLIGYFSNTLIFRSDCSEGSSFEDLVLRVRRSALEAYENQQVPFERIVDVLEPARSLGHSPVVQVVFTFQPDVVDDEVLPGLAVRMVQSPSAGSKFDLVLSMHERRGQVAGRFTYSTALFREQTIRGMARHFSNLLASALAEPDTALEELKMLTAEERVLLDLPTHIPELDAVFEFG